MFILFTADLQTGLLQTVPQSVPSRHAVSEIVWGALMHERQGKCANGFLFVVGMLMLLCRYCVTVLLMLPNGKYNTKQDFAIPNVA